jgi:hypothetical protein
MAAQATTVRINGGLFTGAAIFVDRPAAARASNNPCVFQFLQLLFGQAKLVAVYFVVVRAHFGAEKVN